MAGRRSFARLETHEHETITAFKNENTKFLSGFAATNRLYAHRIAGGHCHHRHSGRDAAAGPGQGQGAGKERAMHQQPASDLCWPCSSPTPRMSNLDTFYCDADGNDAERRPMDRQSETQASSLRRTNAERLLGSRILQPTLPEIQPLFHCPDGNVVTDQWHDSGLYYPYDPSGRIQPTAFANTLPLSLIPVRRHSIWR
jgi:hypothetical protein